MSSSASVVARAPERADEGDMPRLAGRRVHQASPRSRDGVRLTGERIKQRRVGASLGADCAGLPRIDRYGETATVPNSVLRQQGRKVLIRNVIG